MCDWVLNTPIQTDTVVNMWKENIGRLQSTRCNGVLDLIKDKLNKAGLMKNSLQCKNNKIRNSKEAYKRAKEKNRQKAHLYFRHTQNRGGVRI